MGINKDQQRQRKTSTIGESLKKATKEILKKDIKKKVLQEPTKYLNILLKIYNAQFVLESKYSDEALITKGGIVIDINMYNTQNAELVFLEQKKIIRDYIYTRNS